MNREHDDPRCANHWRMGPFSSIHPGPCGKRTMCKCGCHANGVEALIALLSKLGIESARRRSDPWDPFFDRKKY